MPADELLARWRANAEPWADAVRGRRIESRRVATDAAVLAAIRAAAPSSVFDAGCGEGWLVRALRAVGIAACGCDATPALIEAARAHDRSAGDAGADARYAVVRGRGDDAPDGWHPGGWGPCGGAFGPTIPWYFRGLGSWRALFDVHGFGEPSLTTPRHPGSGVPLSWLFVARRRDPVVTGR